MNDDRVTRKIIHVDMDAFFASVEQRDHPELRGKPVAVGGSSRRGVVAAASYEARQFGVKSAMASITAKRLCPDLVFVKSNFDEYKRVSQQVNDIFKQYTDVIEPLSLDEAYLDVTQLAQATGQTATEIAKQIKADIVQQTQLVASAGVSYNKFLAKVASDYDKPDGLYVITPARGEAFVEQLPIRSFRGVGPATEKKLNAMKIYNGADLKAKSLEELQSRFGKYGHYLYHAARAIDERPVKAYRVRKSIGRERTFSQDMKDVETMLAELAAIAEEVEKRMQQRGMVGKTLTLKVKYADFEQVTRAQSLSKPIQLAVDMLPLLPDLLARTEASERPVRLLGLTASHLLPADDLTEATKASNEQIGLFD